MSAVWYRQIKGMIDRGTADLATIDAAEQKRYLTADEAADLRAYWQIVNSSPAPEASAETAPVESEE